VPKLWSETIEAHRRTVRDATLDTAATLVAERGLHAVTMTEIAERTGIGRATLYKYFPDVESILFAWHERELAGHLEQLTEARDQASTPAERLYAVLETFAFIQFDLRDVHATELAAIVHRGEHLARVEQRLRELIRDLLLESAPTGEVRTDVPDDELATYCIAALTAASKFRSKAAVRRLVTVTADGLRPPRR
jgi:AcrR family transcriptional regulator